MSPYTKGSWTCGGHLKFTHCFRHSCSSGLATQVFPVSLQVILNPSSVAFGSSTPLGAPGLSILLDTEMGAIHLDGWKCSKILVISILLCEETIFWAEDTVTSFKTVYSLEAGLLWHGLQGWARFICISGQPTRWSRCGQGGGQGKHRGRGWGLYLWRPSPLPGHPPPPRKPSDTPGGTRPFSSLELLAVLSATCELESRSYIHLALCSVPGTCRPQDFGWKDRGCGGSRTLCFSTDGSSASQSLITRWLWACSGVGVRRKPGLLDATGGSSRSPDCLLLGPVEWRSWPWILNCEFL